jgi:hypothetical protein
LVEQQPENFLDLDHAPAGNEETNSTYTNDKHLSPSSRKRKIKGSIKENTVKFEDQQFDEIEVLRNN